MPYNYAEDLEALFEIAPDRFRKAIADLREKLDEGKKLTDFEIGLINWMWEKPLRRCSKMEPEVIVCLVMAVGLLVMGALVCIVDALWK